MEDLIVEPHILIPLVASGHEIETVTPIIITAYNLIKKEYSAAHPEFDFHVDYKIGCNKYFMRYF